MTVYNINNIIKDYARFPKFLPGSFYSEHGWTPYEYHSPSNLDTEQKLFLVFSNRRVAEWKKNNNIPVVNVGSPFVHFRHMNKIEQDPHAKGTVAFSAHSGTVRIAEFDYESYGNALKSLPEEFHPITICMHFDDIKHGRDKRFKNFDFKIVTAGDRNDKNFVLNFYSILRQAKYTTSNSIGSNVFYAIEMGIPFFIYGEPAVILNPDPTVETLAPEREFINDTQYGKVCYNLFDTGPITYFTKAQLEFVEEELGINDCISPERLNRVLWGNFIRYGFYKYSKRFIKKVVLGK